MMTQFNGDTVIQMRNDDALLSPGSLFIYLMEHHPFIYLQPYLVVLVSGGSSCQNPDDDGCGVRGGRGEEAEVVVDDRQRCGA